MDASSDSVSSFITRCPALPPLGFGAAAIGNLYQPVDDTVAHAAVTAAVAAGIRYIDTAPHYGFGLSESRLGAVLADLDPAEDLLLSTKVGRVLVPISGDGQGGRHGFAAAAPYEPVFDYSYDGVMRSYTESRRRLGRDRIDLLLAHDLGTATHGDAHGHHFRQFLDGGYRAMRDLRDEGAVGAIGLGVNEWQVCLEALGHAEFDVVLLAGRYTLLEQTALDTFFPACEARGIKVIIGGPYNSGILVNGTRGATPLHYNYEPAPPAIVDHVRRLEALCDRFGVPLAAAALQFPLAHPAVVSVIPGMADGGQVAQTQALMNVAIPPGLWQALRADGLLHPAAPTPSSPSSAGKVA
ncbi:aldo/keto reductase [Nitrospirillum iridis]|uniref:D-threo-aldose 1-dehydrogenase n=1 Tax=Nitrospirillum iridis TaxID=765888 RepID=A0A7X0AVJ9_9PROT|nr:aldo/keto reductase [Nitrospirillum iridis]MBB6250909.1 D-threo-aldose 1-dehydrogenase [Nitrospirillum iridis]